MKTRMQKDAPAWAHEIHALLVDVTKRKTVLLPMDVVMWARTHTKSALHSRFEWDDAMAADKWRVHIARGIISETRVYVEGRPDLRVPIAVHLKQDGEGYRLTTEAIEQRPDEVMREEARRLLFSLDRALMFPGLKDRPSLLLAANDLRSIVEEGDEAAA